VVASDLFSDDEVSIPCLPIPSVHAAPASLADSGDEGPILHIPPHSALTSIENGR
jgi:hypothetical protein